MDHNIDQYVRFVLFLMSGIAMAFGLVIWMVVIIRLRRGKSVIKREPREPVPWKGFDLLVVLCVFLIGQSFLFTVANNTIDPSGEQQSVNFDEGEAEHPIAVLMREGDPWILLMCGLAGTVVAPIVEEFLFRVLLQGWLEAIHRHWRQFQVVRMLFPRGVVPVLLVSLLFAVVHFRQAGQTPSELSFLTIIIGGGAVVSLITMAFAIILIRFRTDAGAVDFGWEKEKFWSDVGLGIATFMAIAVPIFLLQAVLKLLLPSNISPDPIPLFFFALALGTLYYRTHRIVPSIVLHMSLNSASLFIAWLTLTG